MSRVEPFIRTQNSSAPLRFDLTNSGRGELLTRTRHTSLPSTLSKSIRISELANREIRFSTSDESNSWKPSRLLFGGSRSRGPSRMVCRCPGRR